MSARVLALVVDPGALRRARITWRSNTRVYRQLLALTDALACAGESGMVITPAVPDPGYMSATQFAAAVGITPAAVRLACRQGRIRAVKRGREWLIPAAEYAARVLAC